LFREPTVWERYWWQIASIVTVLLIQAGLISVLLREHRRRQLAEVQLQHRMTELARVIRFSTAGELTTSIAHEINQPLGSILTNAETADAILQSSSPDIAELKDIVKDILRDDRARQRSHPEDEEPANKGTLRIEKSRLQRCSAGKPSNFFRLSPSHERSN